MVTSENIFAYINRQQSVSSAELAAHFGITRQAINLHIRRLINSGRIEKTGSTRSARYFSATRAPEPAIFSRPFNLRGLDESDVYERVAIVLNLKRTLKSNVGSGSSTSHQRQRSPWLSRLTFLMFRPQPHHAPDPRFIHHRNGISEFQTSPATTGESTPQSV